MTSPKSAIQAAVFQRLKTALPSSVSVVDAADEKTTLPFVDIGHSSMSEGDDKTTDDYVIDLTIEIYTSAKTSRGSKDNADIQDKVRTALKDVALTLTGFSFNWSDYLGESEVARSEDGQFFSSNIQFSFTIQRT